MKWFLCILALAGSLFAQTTNSDILPASTGLNLGHSNQRWNGFFQNVDISGTCTVNGASCFGQSSSGTTNLGVTVASAQAGADWCANVNLADLAIGSGPGLIWLTQAAGATTCSANISISANHEIYDGSCGTYVLGTHSIFVSGTGTTGSAIQGCGRDLTIFTYTGSGSAITPVNSTNNLTRNVRLTGFTISTSGNTGIGIDEHNANSWLVEDFHITGFNGSGGTCIRIRGDGGVSGAYFDRHYNGFLDNCTTAVLINYDIVGNIATSYQFDAVHCNVVANCYDVQGEAGWFRDDYIENVSGIGIRIRGTGINNYFRGINLDNNGSPGVGTGVQFDSGGSDTRFQANISGFSTSVVNSGANNDFTGSNPVTWHVDLNGNFSTFNAADSDDLDVIRCGLTASQNCGITYQNFNATKVWWAGVVSNGNYAIRPTVSSGNSAIEFDNADNINLMPSAGLDNALNVNLTAGSASNQNIMLNFVNKGVTQWQWKTFSAGTLDLFDAAGCARLGFQFGTNGFTSFSGCGTGSTNVAFGGSGGTKFGNGDGTSTVAQIASNGQFISALATGTPPLSIASITPVPTLVVANHPQLEDCGSTTTCAKTPETGALIVRGSVAFPTATTVVVGALPFSSASSYSCTAGDATTAAGVINATTYTSGASVTFTETGGVNTDTARYICVGF